MAAQRESGDSEELPLFMEDLPDRWEENPHLMALQSMAYDGKTVEEQAEMLKQSGNQAYARGKRYYQDAVEFYSRALAIQSSHTENNSVYYSNRAMVHLKLENYGKALEDCSSAISLNRMNIKAYWRASKACQALEKLEEALEWTDRGVAMATEGGLDSSSLDIERREIKRVIEDRRRATEEKEKQRQQEENKKQILVETLRKRGVRMGTPIYATMGQYEGTPYMDEEGEVHWPILLLYEAHHQSEFVQDVCETATLGDVLHALWEGPEGWACQGGCPWDPQGMNRVETMELYFEGGDGHSRWIAAPHEWSVKQLACHPAHLVPGYLVLHVVLREFRDTFLKNPP